jgi:hypothetical protein
MAAEDEDEWSEDEDPVMPVSAKRAHRIWTPDEKLNVHAYAVKRMRLDDDPPSSRRALFKEIEERFKMKRATVEDVLLQVESGEPLEQIVKQPYLNVEDEQSFFHAHALMEKNKVFITQDVLRDVVCVSYSIIRFLIHNLTHLYSSSTPSIRRSALEDPGNALTSELRCSNES